MDVIESITSTPACKSCRYFIPNDGVEFQADWGICKRYPQPAVVEKKESDWCGEFAHA